jgi:hypothetical protein
MIAAMGVTECGHRRPYGNNSSVYIRQPSARELSKAALPSRAETRFCHRDFLGALVETEFSLDLRSATIDEQLNSRDKAGIV